MNLFANTENMMQFKDKFLNYENRSNLFNFISEYNRTKENPISRCLIYKNEQYGGTISKDEINTILKQYPNYDIEIDTLESTDRQFFINFYTINHGLICLALIIDNETKFATISDLRKWDNCIHLQDKNLI